MNRETHTPASIPLWSLYLFAALAFISGVGNLVSAKKPSLDTKNASVVEVMPVVSRKEPISLEAMFAKAVLDSHVPALSTERVRGSEKSPVDTKPLEPQVFVLPAMVRIRRKPNPADKKDLPVDPKTGEPLDVKTARLARTLTTSKQLCLDLTWDLPPEKFTLRRTQPSIHSRMCSK
jgi:hypothetical protein